MFTPYLLRKSRRDGFLMNKNILFMAVIIQLFLVSMTFGETDPVEDPDAFYGEPSVTSLMLDQMKDIAKSLQETNQTLGEGAASLEKLTVIVENNDKRSRRNDDMIRGFEPRVIDLENKVPVIDGRVKELEASKEKTAAYWLESLQLLIIAIAGIIATIWATDNCKKYLITRSIRKKKNIK